MERCPGCRRWYDFRRCNAEEGARADPIDGEVMSFDDAARFAPEVARLETSLAGLDFVLGGGIVPGSLILLCGDAGVGKSTVAIQTLRSLSKRREPTLYVSGEESAAQLGSRYAALGKFPARMQLLTGETDIDEILSAVDEHKPSVVVIDSIQTIEASEELAVGSASSIKLAIREFSRFAKTERVAFIVIGHITKDGAIGGPHALAHAVDVSLFFAGNPAETLRALKCDRKNRFGPTPRSAKFNMTNSGLVPVKDEQPNAKEAAP